MEPFIGQIQLFPYNFAPRGWAFCDGQLLSIAQHSALFALIGTTFGGDGRTTFALPDLRGRVPLGVGQGPGLRNYGLGEQGGEENHTLINQEMPSHTHPATVTPRCSTDDATSGSPVNRVPAAAHVTSGGAAITAFADNANANLAQASVTVNPAGGSQPHNNVQPYLGLNYCISLEGIFPSRP